MRTDDGGRLRGPRIFAALAAIGLLGGADTPDPGKRAVTAIAPAVPGPVVAAIQEGKYAEAATGLDRLIAEGKTAADKSYFRMVRGISERLAGKADEARGTLAAALEADPKGPWASKIRFELAGVELASGKAGAAEALARAEAEELLAPDRKDRLAGVYHAFARRLLKPDDPITPADPRGAHELLELARNLAKGETLRASLLLEMARAGQLPSPGNPNQPPAASRQPDPIRDFKAYLAEYPKGPDRYRARFHLGEAQLAAGGGDAARITWTDLAAEIAKAVPTPDLADLRARSLYQVSKTYGMPTPGDDASLNLGVAALRRFLAAAPEHPQAVRAAYEIAAAYLHRGKAEPAIEALTSFLRGDGFRATTDEAKKDLADLTMTATFQVAQALQGQGRFDRAIEGYRGYLAKFPNGPESADAQRAILDAELLAAQEFLSIKKYAEARAAWTAFVARNPLDARVPEILLASASSLAAEKRWDEAIAAWDALLGQFPGAEPAAHGQFEAASAFEVEKGNPEAAIERFRKVAAGPWKAQADQRVAAMEAKALTVVTPRAFRSGETAHLKITTRNLETLTFTAYKLNAEAYFRKKHLLGEVPSLDVGLVAPDAEWTAPVPGYGKFKPVVSIYDLKIPVPGVYVVKVTDEKTLQATALVVGSDLDAIIKVSREQVLVFAQDMKTGKGRAGARVLVADDSGVILERKTGEDGVILGSWDKPLAGSAVLANGSLPNHETLHYLVLDGADVAGSGLGVPNQVAQGLSPRAYISTDRPAYRPGQEVAIRGVIREAKDGQYANPAGETYKLEVLDAQGRLILAKSTKLSPFGTFHESVRLDPGAPVGSYRVRLTRPGVSDFSGGFEVQAYKLEKLDLAFDLPQTVYYRGQTIKAGIVAKYQYGAPAAGRPIEVALPDGRVVRGQTDASGKFAVEFPTEGFSEEQALRLVARLPGDNVAVAARVMLAVRGFRIDLATTRDVYLAGETFALNATTLDAQGKPTGQELRVSVLKQVELNGRISERMVSSTNISTDKETGEGRAVVRVDDLKGGAYVIRVAGTDQFANPIVADKALTISGKDDAEGLRILTDRQSFKVGETASVNLHARSGAGTALLSWEADRILRYRLAPVSEGNNAISWEVDAAQFPNFTLTATRMAAQTFDRASLDVRVERELRVTLTPTKPTVGPGEEVEVEVTTVDQNGKPAPAEVAVALVDRSLLRLFEDKQTPIGPFFHGQTRTGAFVTESTNTFRDEPATQPVSEAVVEDAERQRAFSLDAVRMGEARAEATRFGYAMVDLPKQQAQGMGGMGGGMPAGVANRSSADMAAAPAPQEAPAKGKRDVIRRRDAGMDAGRMEYDLAKEEGTFDTQGDDKSILKDMYGNDSLGRAANSKTFSELSGRQRQLFASPRERFAETAYWNPSVVTGADGKARFKFLAPMALSEYRFSAKGVTGADTLVGQASGALVVRKDFFVDLKVPASLTQGDRPRFSAQVHLVGVVGKVEVSLTAYSGERQQVYPRTFEARGDGIEEILFEPFDVPDAESVRLTLVAKAGERSDDLTVEVPVNPWGVEVADSASGSASDGATVYVGLPPGRAYEAVAMRIDLAPTLRRLLIDLALGRGDGPLTLGKKDRIIPANTIADRASDLLGATAALKYLQTTRGVDVPEAARLTDRVRGLVAELISAQNPDGGWPWVAPLSAGQTRGNSNRLASAQVVQALRGAWDVAMMTEPTTVEKGTNYLAQEFARAGADNEARASILLALAGFKKATFEQANTLNRSRQGLTDVALAHLALTFHALERDSIAGEVLDVLASRARTEPAGVGKKPRKYWEGRNQGPWHRGAAETTALASLAFARVRPNAPEVEASADWLLAHRRGLGWSPHKAGGPAVAALVAFYGTAKEADDRYRLVVSVNDAEVGRFEVSGPAEGKSVVVPRKVLKVGDRNKVRFEVEGRGTFGYSATITGFARDFAPEQKASGKPFFISDRLYLAADPEFEGKSLPTGFGVAVNPPYFTNKVTQIAQGGRTKVRVNASRVVNAGPPSERDYLVVEDHLPAGATLIEGSVRTSATSFTLADDALTFYFSPENGQPTIEYDLAGYLPGAYRALPARIANAYDPGTAQLGPAGTLTVLAPGDRATDPYRATPDELLARGKALFAAGRLAESAIPLEELFGGYTPRDEVAVEAARMLLTAHIRDYQARKVVQDFEILKEKGPELVIPFEEVLVVGRAYRDIGEPERAYLVFRAIVEASYLEDAQVGEVLRSRGKTLESIAYLLGLWRESPDTASILADFLGLAQALAAEAGRAIATPDLRRELAASGVTRSDLVLQSSRLIQTFLTLSPRNPQADVASLAMLGDFLDLEDFETVARLAPRYAGLYPKSTFLDSFQYSEALARFHLGQYDRAIEVALAIARASYKDEQGVDQASPNKWQALYILGQIHDARRQPAKAIEFYNQVADRFADAAGAVQALSRKDLKLPEVSFLRPPGGKPSGLAPNTVAGKTGVALEYRNVAEVDLKVYPVDLMRLYLTRRNLDGIAGIDLAGITPLHESAIKLGDGQDFAEKSRPLDLPLPKEGAYLVMARGENLYASGIVLVSPLVLEVLEEPQAGRVRVVVRDAGTGDLVPKVQVKVIGTDNPTFFTGQTDLRGVFVAEGVNGQVTAVARKGAGQYAFYRGNARIGLGRVVNGGFTPFPPAASKPGAEGQEQGLDQNLKSLNIRNQQLGIDRLQNRFNGGRKGIKAEEAR